MKGSTLEDLRNSCLNLSPNSAGSDVPITDRGYNNCNKLFPSEFNGTRLIFVCLAVTVVLLFLLRKMFYMLKGTRRRRRRRRRSVVSCTCVSGECTRIPCRR